MSTFYGPVRKPEGAEVLLFQSLGGKAGQGSGKGVSSCQHELEAHRKGDGQSQRSFHLNMCGDGHDVAHDTRAHMVGGGMEPPWDTP